MSKLAPMDRRTTVKKRLVAAALAVVAAPSERRLKTAWNGQRIGIPAPLLRDLETELEAEWPGMVARCRARMANS